MTNKRLKNMIREAYTEVLAEKEKTEKKQAPKKEAPKKVTPKVSKKDLDQTKDSTIDTGDAVVAARKEKIALSKGDKDDAAFYKKVKDIVNKRKGSKV
jgi:hypothetical protein